MTDQSGARLQYLYPHFQRRIFIEDLAFSGGPRPGEPMPDFDLLTTDGDRVRKSDYVGHKPLLLIFASITCPLVASEGRILKRLHEEFGDRVAFVTLYVREAHPGERYPQPETLEQKRRYACDYRQRDQIFWPVAVDSLEGDLHRALNPRANAAYLMDTNGHVAFRTLFSNDERVLREVLKAIASGRQPRDGESQRRLVPLLRGMGAMDSTLNFSGRQARQDVWRETPLLYGMMRSAAWFRPLPPLGRGIAAAGTALLVLVVLCVLLTGSVKRGES